jgi:hypothetical protein
VSDAKLTFHIGNEIGWSRHIDYIEHNLGEALTAVARMRSRYNVPANGVLARMERNHFKPNARLDTVLLRRVKRVGLIGELVHTVKKALGRGH